MAKSLKQYVKCIREQENSNFSLLTLLTEAKDAAFEFIASFIPKIDIIGAINDAIESGKAVFYRERDALIAEFTAIKDQITDTIDSITGSKVVKCAFNDEDPQKPTINVAALSESIPFSNDEEDMLTSSEIKKAKEFVDSKTASLEETANTITNHIKANNSSGIFEQRENVRKYKNYHPLVNKYTESLPMFQPISQYIGSSVIGYSPDKSGLILKEWTSLYPIIEYWNPNESPPYAPACYKRVLANKLDNETIEIGQIAYENLTKDFVSNISRQLKDETVGIGLAHSAYIIGDFIFSSQTIPNIEKQVEKVILDELGDSAILDDFIYPIDTNIEVSSDFYSVEIEGESCIIDKRGNIVINPQEKVNNDIFKTSINK